jgi:glycosyl transferase family 25
LLKIERFGPPNQRALVEGLTDVGGGRQIGRLRSKHTGAAAYILDRATAQMLLDWPQRWSLPVDHMLFNPNNSPLAKALRPWQLTPVIARQTAEIGGATDIDSWRKEMRKIRGPYLKRALVRGYYELRPLPAQLMRLLTGKARLVRVEANGSAGR